MDWWTMLKGIVSCKGSCDKIEGVAYVLDINKSNLNVKLDSSKDILVIPYTYIDLEEIMKNAKAIITERGGILSHAAIFSREFGVPCVVSVKDVCSKLKNGDNIEIDLLTGEINIK